MDRREFLTLAAASAVVPAALLSAAEPVIGASRRANVVYGLPHSSHRRIAWTVDDGCSARAIHRYIDHVEQRNARLTFFVYSGMSGWRANQPRLQPFIDSGQIQVANHTHGHPDLRTLSSAKIRRQLLDCHHFLQDVYGVDARPFFRPPYGAYNKRVREVAADLGYTKLMMWSGTLADSGHISLAREMYFARRYMRDATVLLGHANNLNADKLFDRMYRITTSRHLATVTLNDAWGLFPKLQGASGAPTNSPSIQPTDSPSAAPSI